MHIQSIEIEGLWSYREHQRVDVSGLPLVVATGENGTGKSTLLVSSLLVAFYGKFPTKTIEESITTGCAQGNVSVEFMLGDTLYRVGRNYPIKGTASGVVAIADSSEPSGWRTVTEKGIREVNTYITELLGMNYETATMTWLAEQGQYGKFSAAVPSERFKLLSSIFGLDDYAPKATAAKLKLTKAEAELERLSGRINQLQELLELEFESTDEMGLDKFDAAALEAKIEHEQKEIDRIGLELVELNAADPKRKTIELSQALDLIRSARLHKLESGRAAHERATALLATARARGERERGNAQVQYDSAVSAAAARTAAARSRAEAMRTAALSALEAVTNTEASLPGLRETVQTQTDAANSARTEAATVASEISAASARVTALLAEWATLKVEHTDAEKRIETLQRSESADSHASCFTCGQHLSAEDATALIEVQRKDLARIAARQQEVKDGGISGKALVVTLEAKARTLADTLAAAEPARSAAEATLVRAEQVIASRTERQSALDDADIALTTAGDSEAAEVEAARVARDTAVVAATDEEDTAITAAGFQLTESKADVDSSSEPTDEETRLAGELAAAEEATADATADVARRRTELEDKRGLARIASKVLIAEVARRAEVAANRTEMETRLAAAETEREAVETDRMLYATLQKAFSPGGIPAMILGGVVDELNEAVNASLLRLSNGDLSVELRTSRETSSGSTENKVTVFVATPTGVRSYESLSGGQKFRVDLAIRTGLNQAVARGTGTPIQTFVLDEGWGALDEKGILSTFDTLARLSETTNVLTVSHIDSVKEAFPVRIEVSMSSGHSVAEVVR